MKKLKTELAYLLSLFRPPESASNICSESFAREGTVDPCGALCVASKTLSSVMVAELTQKRLWGNLVSLKWKWASKSFLPTEST